MWKAVQTGSVPGESDVVVLGAGIIGSALAAVLARAGLRVTLLESASPARRPIGESITPQSAMMLRLLARRYRVPELGWPARGPAVLSHISPGSGVKEGFGFLYHRPGRPQDPRQSNQGATPKWAGAESHLRSEDTERWLASVAARYGASAAGGVRVAEVAVEGAGATVVARDGRCWRTRFVVDTDGPGDSSPGPLPGARESTTLRHHSRALYTHLAGVAMPAELTGQLGADPRRCYRATLYHVFEGGQLWVAPLGAADGSHPLAAVGLSLDPRVYPDPGCGPAAEFDRMLERFPGLAEKFRRARPVRDWTATGRLQHNATSTVGPRWCRIGQAAGFVDPLYCLGLAGDLVSVGMLAGQLLPALAEDDLAVERFAPLARLQAGLARFQDDLIGCSYLAFRDYELWNCWFRLWLLVHRLSIFALQRCYGRFRLTEDLSAVTDVERLAERGCLPDDPAIRDLFDRAVDEVRAVGEGRQDPAEAVAGLLRLFEDAERSSLVPLQFGLADAGYRRNVPGSGRRISGVFGWAKRDAPPEMGAVVLQGLTHAMRTNLAPAERVGARRARAALRTGAEPGRAPHG
jgi:FADH2 O2-dependent halogenase